MAEHISIVSRLGKKKKRNTEQTREERDMNKYVYMITIDVFSV